MDAEDVSGKVSEDFKFWFDNISVFGVLLYGSVVKGESNERSDIDVCVVAPSVSNKIGFLRGILSNVRDVY